MLIIKQNRTDNMINANKQTEQKRTEFVLITSSLYIVCQIKKNILYYTLFKKERRHFQKSRINTIYHF